MDMEIKETAYCGYRELEDMDYLPVEDNIQEIFEHLSLIASDNPHLEKEWEKYNVEPKRYDYPLLIDKELYLIRYDTDTGYCTLHKVKSCKTKGEIKNENN